MDMMRTLLHDRVLTREEAAQFLARSPDMIDIYVDEGKLKVHRIGKSPVFILSELLAAVATEQLASTAPLPTPPRPFQPKPQAKR